MKIRDLEQYIKWWCEGEYTPDKLGTKDEIFLKKTYGVGQNLENLVSSVASFATQAHEQLFYEFVQNAYDADAQELQFYINENYLIVVNNGKPFYTDNPNADNRKKREGQLFSFLTKGKSDKIDDENLMGAYGQGSKLLYTLLADDTLKDTEEEMRKAIIENNNGPIIISWNNMTQLENLLINKNSWEPSTANNEEDNILLAKILYTYYPIMPGVNQELFSDEEVHEAIATFDKLIDPRRNKYVLNRGTAIIIPLGKGKYEKINNKNNIENVRNRLGCFAAVSSAKNNNKNKNLDKIYVFNHEIERYEADSLFINFNEEDVDFDYHFIFNSSFAKNKVPNLFKWLPVTATTYGYGFIIDSTNFEIDGSRQRIKDREKTSQQLEYAYDNLFKQLDQYKTKDPEKYNRVYTCILSSVPDERTEDGKELKKSLVNELRPYLRKNIYTESGIYIPIENARTLNLDIDIDFPELGMNTFGRADRKLEDDYKRFDILSEIKECSFVDFIKNADKEKLTRWIKSLNEHDYKTFQKESVSFKEEVPDIQIFRSNKGNLFSWNEIIDEKTQIYFFNAETNRKVFTGCEYIVEPVSSNCDVDEIIYNKLCSGIEIFRSTNEGLEQAENIINFLLRTDNKKETYMEKIRTNIRLFKDFSMEYRPFKDLLFERPEKTKLFDTFCVFGYKPSNLNPKLFMTKEELPKWMEENIDRITELTGWGDRTDEYIDDIKNICVDSKVKIKLNINERGIPTTHDTYCISTHYHEISEKEYQTLTAVFSEYDFVPYKHNLTLSHDPFETKQKSSEDLFLDYRKTLDAETVKILINISDNRFLDHYKIIDYGDSKYEIKKIEENERNYIDIFKSNELVDALDHAGFIKVPGIFVCLFNSSKDQYSLSTSSLLLKRAIYRINNTYLLHKLVKSKGDDIVEYYLNKISTISIDNNIEKSDPRWILIKELGIRFNEKVFNMLRIGGQPLPKSRKSDILKAYERKFDLYKILPELKKDNELIDKFVEFLPDKNWFIDNFYKNKTESTETVEVANSLKNRNVNISQIEFLLYYNLYENEDIEITAQVKSSVDFLFSKIKTVAYA